MLCAFFKDIIDVRILRKEIKVQVQRVIAAAQGDDIIILRFRRRIIRKGAVNYRIRIRSDGNLKGLQGSREQKLRILFIPEEALVQGIPDKAVGKIDCAAV